jgi:hypothetical protein
MYINLQFGLSRVLKEMKAVCLLSDMQELLLLMQCFEFVVVKLNCNIAVTYCHMV